MRWDIPIIIGLVAGLFLGAFSSPQVFGQTGGEEIRKEIEKEFESARKSLLEKISKILSRKDGQIAELKKAVNEKDREIDSLKKKMKELEEDLKKAKAPAEKPKVAKPTPERPKGNPFLGVEPAEPSADDRSKLNLKQDQGVKIITIQRESPADQAGVQPGDIILSIDGKDVNFAKIRDLIRTHAPGDKVELVILRGAEKIKKTAQLADRDRFLAQLTLKPVVKKPEPPKPTPPKTEPVVLGLLVEENKVGPLVLNVEPGKTGATAKIKEGDILLSINGKKINTLDNLSEILDKTQAGQEITIDYQRKGETYQAKVLGAGERGNSKLLTLKEPEKKPAEVEKPVKPPAGKPGVLGVQVWENGGVRVGTVRDGGAAEAAGIREGDVIVEIDKKAVKSIEDLKKILSESPAGSTISVTVLRSGERKVMENVKLGDGSPIASSETPKKEEPKKEPAKPKKVRGVLGITAWENDGKGLLVSSVNPKGPADQGGIRKDDIILKINGVDIRGFEDFEKVLKTSYAGDVIRLSIKRGQETKEIQVKLGSPETSSVFPPREEGPPVYLGASLLEEIETSTSTGTSRVAIHDVYDESPAADAGLQEGDEILAIDNRPVRTLEDIGGTLGLRSPGERVQFRVFRNGEMLDTGVILGKGSGK